MVMRKTNLAMEIVLLAFGILPLGLISAIYWLITGKVPNALLYGMVIVFTACVIAGIEERIEKRRDNAEELKKHD